MFLSAQTITKSAWLFAAAVGVCLSITPPQPEPPEEFRKKFNPSPTATNSGGWFGYNKVVKSKFTISYLPRLFSALVVAVATLDAIHTFDLFPEVMPINHTAAARTFNIRLVAGLALTTTSAGFRLAAYHALGKLFTYQLAIFPDHKLVTHGVYAYCRHPSYVGALLSSFGACMTMTAPGSVLHDRFGEDAMRILITMVGLGSGYFGYAFADRADLEDRVLQKEFGKEWEDWARRVPYKFIPYLI